MFQKKYDGILSSPGYSMKKCTPSSFVCHIDDIILTGHKQDLKSVLLNFLISCK